MELPIRFPTEQQVIDDEVARFRALSPAEQFETLDDMFRLYHIHWPRTRSIRAMSDAELTEHRPRFAVRVRPVSRR